MSSTSKTLQDATLEHHADAREFRLSAPFEGAVVRYSRPRDGVLDLYSTFVPDALRGQGVAQRLVEDVLQHVKAEGLRVVPSCWYVDVYLNRNPQWQELRA